MISTHASQTDRLLESLRAEGIETWFDLGLLLDRLREDRPTSSARVTADRRAFRRSLAGGVAFVTYNYTIDGVTMEIVKYAAVLREILPDPTIHFVGSHFDPRTRAMFHGETECHELDGLEGFDSCSVYKTLFGRRLERGAPEYNRLIGRLWQDTLSITERLGHLLEERGIRLIFAVNTNSNPGNPALALALVVLSEHLDIPVISNNHDFYWEGGHSEIERATQGMPKGPRDHFFINEHLGEVFSIIQMTHPWEGRRWLSLNLSRRQSDELIATFGHNPASVCEVGTAVDTRVFAPLPRSRRVEVLRQLATLLGGDEQRVRVHDVAAVMARGDLVVRPHRPILLAARDGYCADFTHDNIILLQPTRIIARKKIELIFHMLDQLLQDHEMLAALAARPSLTVTVMITGPVADGQQGYLNRLLGQYGRFGNALPESLRGRVFLALLFAGIDDPGFHQHFERPCRIADIYGVASLVCLPSETEGRGLPIIEAAACGVPALVRRYEPKEVFAELIGEHLASDERLQVIEFSGTKINRAVIEEVRKVLLNPQNHTDLHVQNRHVVEQRFTMGTLTTDLELGLERLHLQLQSNERPLSAAASALEQFQRRVRAGAADLGELVDTRHREYLPGDGRMAFMLMLKSLIDPSYFRIEEQRIRGRAFAFARRLTGSQHPGESTYDRLRRQRDYYDTVDSLFLYRAGELSVRFDHALAYRHRNRRRYLYRELTPQELTGVISVIHQKQFAPKSPRVAPRAVRHFSSWHRGLTQLCSGEPAIDQRQRLLDRLGRNVPFAFFPGTALQLELELFVLQAVRARLGMHGHEALSAEQLKTADLAPIFLIVRSSPCANAPTFDSVKAFLAESLDDELRQVFRHGICRAVRSHQLSVGIDARQLGQDALDALRSVRARNGFLLATTEQAAMTTDILDLERFHVGRVEEPVCANVMGLSVGDAFVQWVPASLRVTLAYPTPIQTARSLAETLESDRYARLCARLGEDVVLERVRDDARHRGSPVEAVLAELASEGESKAGPVLEHAITGVYADGNPWSGNLARVDVDAPLAYRVLSSDTGPRTVVEFVEEHDRCAVRPARIAWNGGYVLNAELVGKLGLPELYIGSPLGLIISDGRTLCPPLFKKPAFLVDSRGALSIRRVDCSAGMEVSAKGTRVMIEPEQHNPPVPPDLPCGYDLLFSDDTLPGDGRVLVRLAGTRIVQVVRTGAGETVPVQPVGLVLSFPAEELPPGWNEGTELTLRLRGFEDVSQAIQAGPMLLEGAELCIDMSAEGWKSGNSIRTQAARLDYLDLRGPKIALGLDRRGGLAILTVNGRIRESVGATHGDMARILRKQGLVTAMGFDPGGSSTLVVDGRTVNISPYNRDYEQNVYALPPQPRAVGNIVLGVAVEGVEVSTPHRGCPRGNDGIVGRIGRPRVTHEASKLRRTSRLED